MSAHLSTPTTLNMNRLSTPTLLSTCKASLHCPCTASLALLPLCHTQLAIPAYLSSPLPSQYGTFNSTVQTMYRKHFQHCIHQADHLGLAEYTCCTKTRYTPSHRPNCAWLGFSTLLTYRAGRIGPSKHTRYTPNTAHLSIPLSFSTRYTIPYRSNSA